MLRYQETNHSSVFRLYVNSGFSRTPYFQFAYTLSPDPTVETILVSGQKANKDGSIWLTDLRRGVVEFFTDDRGRPDIILCSVRVEIDYIWYHDIDTTDVVVYRRGIAFAKHLSAVTTVFPPFDPVWRTNAVLSLADSVVAERAYDRLPILADALEEAGCDNALALAHCRTCVDHAPGCWVIKWVRSGALPARQG
ncbi:hypothetical protein [Fimbriiglobus ruber]|uniref:Uncharacterized protein n=1 Tax=Fimbriiglobus ruber TaxID=1908690 RepID=A0A225DUU7_9BACT|nr:hypothetical protein [Fimbriiglobus ruber]OWK40919.1 hypothetical protein FRUB_04811 [Fimbriiglobus ruber]